MLPFKLDQTSGIAPYLQLVRQVRYALRLGLLNVGDQLPTVKGASIRLGINQNTVLKAYRELEYDGLVITRPGVGTFIQVTLADASLAAHGALREQLHRWMDAARKAGLDEETIGALVDATLHNDGPHDGSSIAS